MAKKENIKTSKKNIVWSSKRVNSWMKDYSEGVMYKDTPWSDGVVGVRSPNLIFEYTPEEIEEITKCAGDIKYFANTYCYCMQGSRGYQPLTLRDYQEEMIDAYDKNRFCITLSSRQIGKCSFSSYINTLDGNININDLYMSNCDDNKSILFKIKKYLYKLYKKL